MSACDHRWQRLPIVDLGVTYRCEKCKRVLRVTPWVVDPALTFDDVDRLFEAKHGGKVCQGT